MIRSPRRAFVVSAMLGCALAASTAPAGASPPDPRFSVVEPFLVGCPSGTPLPGCDRPGGATPGFQVIVRDVNNSPDPGRMVTLDFSATPMRLFGDTRSGTTVNCAAATISRVCDNAGEVTFAPRVGGRTTGSFVVVHADGVVLGLLSARSTDFDGDGRTGLSDLAVLTAHFLDPGLVPSPDLDGCSEGGVLSLRDFAIFAAEFQREVDDLPCR